MAIVSSIYRDRGYAESPIKWLGAGSCWHTSCNGLFRKTLPSCTEPGQRLTDAFESGTEIPHQNTLTLRLEHNLQLEPEQDCYTSASRKLLHCGLCHNTSGLQRYNLNDKSRVGDQSSLIAEVERSKTNCTDSSECATLAYSVCDTIITQKCVCVTSQGFTTNANDDGCDYDCGVLSEPNNGAVSYKSTIQDSVAMYGCHAGFQIDGVTRRTCSVVKPKGWSGVAPSCIAGQLGDLCNTITDLCDNIINGECSVLDIDDCASQPCLNEGTCLEGVAQFACACVQGYSGSLCQDGVGDKAVQTLTIITAISSLVTVVLLTIGGIAIACTRKRGKAVQSHKEQNFMMSSARDSRDIENVSQIMDYEVLGNRDSNNADRRSYQDLHGINKT
ncbi:SNED1-like protein [Mya arenaria]|uniref:SNED1-like protein n=1 Tax=Mya arenaria TaxID=6604 RepID=A0ABY7EF92_MYAAR|nr:SNED1-like protein [Mya arenaria]